MTAKIVLMDIEPHVAYVPEDVERHYYNPTLGDMLRQIQRAVDEHGEDAVVVTYDGTPGRGQYDYGIVGDDTFREVR